MANAGLVKRTSEAKLLFDEPKFPPGVHRAVSRAQDPLRLRRRVSQSRFIEHLAEAPVEDRDHLVDLLGRRDQRRAEGDPVRVEAAEQAVRQGPAADPHAEAASREAAPCVVRSRTNSIAWNSPLPRMSPMTPYFSRQPLEAGAEPLALRAGVAAEVALEDLARARRSPRRTRSGCPRRCAPRRSRGSPRSAPRRRRRSAGGRSSPRAGRSRRSAPWPTQSTSGVDAERLGREHLARSGRSR